MEGSKTNQTELNGALHKLSQELASRGVALVITEAGSVIVLLTLSFLGNAFVCAAIVQNPVLSCRRILTNIFVFGLAVSDLLMACLCMPFCIGVLLRGMWTHGYFTCQLQGFVVCFLASTSLYTMLLISVNRYVRVVRPAVYHKIFTYKSTVAMLVCLWMVLLLLGIALTQPDLVEVRLHPGRAMCLPFVANEMKKYTYVVRVFGVFFVFLIPSAVITTTYYKVYTTVRAHQLNTASSLTQTSCHPRNSDQDRARCSLQEIKMTRTLYVVMFAFGAVVFSLIAIEAFFTVVNVTQTKIDVPRLVHLLWTGIGLSSSAINPFIYMMTCRAFIVSFRKLLRCKSPRGVMPSELHG